MKVNFIDLQAQYLTLESLLAWDLADTIERCNFVGAESFENKFAEFHDSKYCVGVGSGADALYLSLLALGIGPGDEVIVPAHTYIATAFAVSHTGATPVFVDPNPHTYVMMTDNLGKVLTTRTKAIIPVHLYGQPASMNHLMLFADAYNLKVVEDCAQSAGASIHGKKTGTFGDTGCYSFYPTKNLGGLGQGGAVITDNEHLATTIRELGNHGRRNGTRDDYIHVGLNSRLDGINARFLERCLGELEVWNIKRNLAAFHYRDQLDDLNEIILPTTYIFDPVFHLYTIKCQTREIRDQLKVFLTTKDIGCSIYYPTPCHKQPVYEHLNASCPVSEELSDTVLSLPMHPNLQEEEINYVCDNIKEFYNGLK